MLICESRQLHFLYAYRHLYYKILPHTYTYTVYIVHVHEPWQTPCYIHRNLETGQWISRFLYTTHVYIYEHTFL